MLLHGLAPAYIDCCRRGPSLASPPWRARRLLDLRVSHRFVLGGKKAVEIFADIFNVLNDAAVTSRGERYDSSYYNMVFDQEPPRTFRLGAKLLF